jgi:hypothetical protein
MTEFDSSAVHAKRQELLAQLNIALDLADRLEISLVGIKLSEAIDLLSITEIKSGSETEVAN